MTSGMWSLEAVETKHWPLPINTTKPFLSDTLTRSIQARNNNFHRLNLLGVLRAHCDNGFCSILSLYSSSPLFSFTESNLCLQPQAA